jgi:hypothetical protein
MAYFKIEHLIGEGGRRQQVIDYTKWYLDPEIVKQKIKEKSSTQNVCICITYTITNTI